jgi:biotin carboxyl carrier protein
VYALRFPPASAWTDELVEQLNATAVTGAAFQLGGPDNTEQLLELNRELAARAVALCVVAAVDCFHLLSARRYDEQFDDATAAAALVADDWPADLGLSAEVVADPAYHLLHRAARLLRRADEASARDVFIEALRWNAADQQADGLVRAENPIRLATPLRRSDGPLRDKIAELLPRLSADPVVDAVTDALTNPPKAEPAASGPSAGAADNAVTAKDTRVTLPNLSKTVSEGTVTQWLKSIGDQVTADEPLLEVSILDDTFLGRVWLTRAIPAPASGTLLAITVQKGQTVAVGSDLAVIGTGAANSAAPSTPAAQPRAGVGGSGGEQPPPPIRRLAAKLGVDLRSVTGTGADGRIRVQDVTAAAAQMRNRSVSGFS